MGFTAVQFDDAAKKRIAAAAAIEKRLRIEAYLNVETRIGPFLVRPMLVRHALEMEYGENRLNQGEAPELDDLVHFLWVLRSDRDLRTEKAFAKFAVNNITQEIRDEIVSYFGFQFLDMPGKGDTGKTKIIGNDFDSSVWLSVMLDELCNSYGWTIDEVMKTPMSVALQLIQRIIKRHDSKYPIRNPITQAAKAEELKNFN
jgi:hypothetical protein